MQKQTLKQAQHAQKQLNALYAAHNKAAKQLNTLYVVHTTKHNLNVQQQMCATATTLSNFKFCTAIAVDYVACDLQHAVISNILQQILNNAVNCYIVLRKQVLQRT